MLETTNNHSTRETQPSGHIGARSEDCSLKAIAIIGLAGRFPGANDIHALWERLSRAEDCITEVPSQRWRVDDVYAEKKGTLGKTNCRWGGFIDDIAAFDPLFFNISPREAREMDPQERLFLQSVWTMLETSGYPPVRLQRQHANRVGVYVGAMHQQYDMVRSDAHSGGGMSLSSVGAIANRVSNFLDLRGPSIAVDTMCSSTALAIHLACASLQQDECELAIAGGVNLSIHPDKYIGLAQASLLASSPASRSFHNGDGHLPAEAVGAILLKTLRRAEMDGDDILGVIRASVVAHSGRGKGYAKANQRAQTELIEAVLHTAGVNPRTISYVEAAASGSSIADAIELNALTSAFRRWTKDVHFCHIGSVKSLIGHAEGASALTQLAKILLQMHHGQLPPTSGGSLPGVRVDLNGTPFVLSDTLVSWDAPMGEPRRALINAFGAGGTYVSLVVESHSQSMSSGSVRAPSGAEHLVVFSARTMERLGVLLSRVRDHLVAHPDIRIDDLAFTSQTRREPMSARWSVIAQNHGGVVQAIDATLSAWSLNEPLDGTRDIFTGDAAQSAATAAFTGGELGRMLCDAVTSSGNLRFLAMFWCGGGEVSWADLHTGGTARAIALPTYPFDIQQYWVTDASNLVEALSGSIQPPADPLGSALATLLELQAHQLSEDATLASYGLKSIDAVRLRVVLEQQLGCQIPLATFAPNVTLRDARSRIAHCTNAGNAGAEGQGSFEQAHAAMLPMVVPNIEEGHAPFPLTDLQQSFVVGRRLRNDAVGAHIYVEFEVCELDVEYLDRAWQMLLERHAMLRMVVLADGRQKILEAAPTWHIACTDFSVLPMDAQASAASERGAQMAHRVYDVTSWPLFDVQVSRLSDVSIVHISIDELLADGMSLALLLREWQLLYRDPQIRLPPLMLSFRDYVLALDAYDGSARQLRDLRYWLDRTPHLPPGPDIGRILHADGQAHCLERSRLAACIDARGWAALNARATKAGVSPTVLMLTVFCELLRGWSRTTPFSLLLTFFNRLPIHPQVDQVVGPFLSTNLFVVDAAPKQTFDEQMVDHQTTLWNHLEHASVSSVRLLREMKRERRIERELAIPVVFTSLLDTFDLGDSGQPSSLWHKQRAFVNQTPQVYLDHQVVERDGALHLSWDVAVGLFDPGEIEQKFAAYVDSLTAMGEGEDAAVALALLTEPADGVFAPFPITEQQKAYLFGRSRHAPGGGVSALHYLEFDVALPDTLQIEAAFNRVVRTHGMLMTHIGHRGEQQLLRDIPTVAVRVDDLRDMDHDARMSALNLTRRDLSNLSFDPTSWPYLECRVSRIDDVRSRLHIAVDMLVADPPGIGIIVRDLLRVCLAPTTHLTARLNTYRNYARALARHAASPAGAEDLRYWDVRFQEMSSGPTLLVTWEAPLTGHSPELTCRFDGWRALQARADRIGVPVSMLLLVAYLEVLAEWSGSREFAVVVPCWCDAKREEVGDFTRLAWVACSSVFVTLDQHARRAYDTIQADLAHSGVSGLVAISRAVAGQHKLAPRYPVVFSEIIPRFELTAGAQQVYELTRTPQVDLDNISYDLGDVLEIRWDVVPGKFSASTLESMFTAYLRIVRRLATDHCDVGMDEVSQLLSGNDAVPGIQGGAEHTVGVDMPPLFAAAHTSRTPTPAQAHGGTSIDDADTYYRALLGDYTEPAMPYGIGQCGSYSDPSQLLSRDLDALLVMRLYDTARAAGTSAISVVHLACRVRRTSSMDSVPDPGQYGFVATH